MTARPVTDRPVTDRPVTVRRRAAVLVLTLAAVLLPATSAAAATNPVLDAEADADLAESLADAQEVQGVCYGYVLRVRDDDTGVFGGTYASSSVGPGRPASAGTDCRAGVVQLEASISYASEFSESEDSASWSLRSSLPSLSIADVERLTGSSAGDLLDDGKSETALLNAVLSLPGLASEKAGVPPLVAEPNTEPLPEQARATGTPGSDWRRENGGALTLCVLAVLGGIGAFMLSRRTPRPEPSGGDHWSGPGWIAEDGTPYAGTRPDPTSQRTFGPRPQPPPPPFGSGPAGPPTHPGSPA